MKQRMVALLAVAGLAALVSGGCANKEAVVTEQPAEITARQQSTATVKPVTPEVKPAQPAQQPTDQGTSPKIEPARPVAAEVKPAQAEARLETVYFDFDKSDLRQDSRNVLARNAEVLLKSRQGAKVRIEGNCDERGSAEYNLALGERRAKSVQQYLTTLGVQTDRLSTISYGKEKPAVQGNDEAAWAKNRRAEFVIVK